MFEFLWDVFYTGAALYGGWYANNKIGPGKVETDRKAIMSGKA